MIQDPLPGGDREPSVKNNWGVETEALILLFLQFGVL